MKTTIVWILVLLCLGIIMYGAAALSAHYYNDKLGTNYTPTEVLMGLHKVRK